MRTPTDDDDDDGRELSLRVMQLEYLPSMHALVALTPRRGVTIHHLSRGSNAGVTIRSGRVSGTSGAVAFALDASGAHPSCVAVSRAGKPGHRSVTFREIVRQDDDDDRRRTDGRPRRFKPRATAVPFGKDVRLGAAHPALSLTWHADVAKLVVGNGRWYHVVDARDGASTDVVPMTGGSSMTGSSLETSRRLRRFPTTLAIAEGDGTRSVVCVTGTHVAVVSPLGAPAGCALRLGSSTGRTDDDRDDGVDEGAYSLAFAAPYLVAAPVRGSAPAAVFDRAVLVGEPREGEPVQFLSLFDAGTAQTEREGRGGDGATYRTYVAGEGAAGTLVACSGSLVEVYAKAPVIAQVKGMLSTPGWWAPATRLADAQREDLDLDFSRDERDESESAADADADADAGSTAARSLPPWIVAHAEAGFCAARALDFDAACSHWRLAGADVVRPVEDVARTFLPRLLPRPPEETVHGDGPEVSSVACVSSAAAAGATSEKRGAGVGRRRRFWNLAPPPADLDSVVAATMRTWTAGTTRAARRSVAPIAGDVTGGVAPIAPVDPNAHPEPSRSHDANPKENAKDQTAPNVSLAPGGSTFRATLLRAKRALSTYLSAHRTNAPGFEVNTVCLALWAECGECDALERYLASRAGAFEVLPGSKSRVPPPYDADVVKDACRRNSRWHALAILLEAHGRRPRGERDEEDAMETWRSLATGEKREGGDCTVSGDGTSDEIERSSGADSAGGADSGGAVRRLGARRVGCDFATAALVRVAADAANRRTDDEIRRIAQRHVAWIADVDPRRALELLTHARIVACVPLRAALRVLDESPACTPSEPAEYLRARVAARASGHRASVAGFSDVDAKELHTKYATALVNAAGDPRCAHRDHATELHNFLSRSEHCVCDAAVVARAIDPRGLTESDARGDLRGFAQSLVRDGGDALGTVPCTRGFESHLVLLRRRLGDHAAAIRLILDVVTHEGGVAGAEAAAEKYVERCQSGRARFSVRRVPERDRPGSGGRRIAHGHVARRRRRGRDRRAVERVREALDASAVGAGGEGGVQPQRQGRRRRGARDASADGRGRRRGRRGRRAVREGRAAQGRGESRGGGGAEGGAGGGGGGGAIGVRRRTRYRGAGVEAGY